jgi:hypothetical protein
VLDKDQDSQNGERKIRFCFNDTRTDSVFFTKGVATTASKSEGVRGRSVVKAVQRIADRNSDGQHFTWNHRQFF